jgi:arylsulfatase
MYTYNWLGLQRYTVTAKQALPAGKATIRFDFARLRGSDDGGGRGGPQSAKSNCLIFRG